MSIRIKYASRKKYSLNPHTHTHISEILFGTQEVAVRQDWIVEGIKDMSDAKKNPIKKNCI